MNHSSHTNRMENHKALINVLDCPILLMQADPRQVITANKKACELFGKDLAQIEGHRGGQVFDCIHAFTEAGCGLDVNCENCKIKRAVVDTFSTGNSFHSVKTILDIKKHKQINTYEIQVSTEKIGDFALITIEKYEISA